MKLGGTLLRSVIKEALDTLPMGLAFFDMKGRVVLYNSQMYRLFYLIGNQDLQNLSELEDALASPQNGVIHHSYGYQFPDGSFWKFAKHLIKTQDGKEFWEMQASDVTDLHQKNEELRQQNEIKEENLQRLQHIYTYLEEATREQEILDMKMKVHSDMGDGLRNLQHYLSGTRDPAQKEKLLWEQGHLIQGLLGEIHHRDEVDPFQEFLQIMDSLDCKLVMDGEMPTDSQLRLLICAILRESRTNMIRHGKAKTMFVSLSEANGKLHCEITDDGTERAEPVVEGGGLTSLRNKIESFGGTMEVEGEPRYKLTVELAKEEENV